LIRTTIAYLRYHSDAHVSATGLEEISPGLFGGKIFGQSQLEELESEYL
jgi:hypothetical protein